MIIPLGKHHDSAFYKILVLASTTPGLPDLRPLSEGSTLEELGKLSKEVGLWTDALVGDVTVEDLSDALLTGGYNGMHCVVHGSQAGVMIGDTFVKETYFASLLSQHDLKFALLLSCGSARLAKQVAENGVPFVVGCSADSLPNDTARLFAREFYKHLVLHHDPHQAFLYALSRLPDDTARQPFHAFEAPSPDILTQILTHQERLEKIVQESTQRTLNALAATRKSLRASNREVIRAVMALVGVMSNGDNGDDGNDQNRID